MGADGAGSHIAIVFRRGAGSHDIEAAHARVAQLFKAAGVEARTALVSDNESFARAVGHARDSNPAAIVIGGGDGSVGAAAAVLAGGDIALGIIPLGTFNHLARDLGIPMELDAAVRVILAGQTARIDTGEVNGRVFVNTASMGLYPRIVRARARIRGNRLRKLFVSGWTALRSIDRTPILAVRITAEGQSIVRRTPLLLVGNNEYSLQGLEPASRASLSEGVLSIYVVKARGLWQLLRLVWRSFWHGAHEADLLDVFRVEEAMIETRSTTVAVALDGELTMLRPPLEYRIRNAALRVFVP